MLNQWVNAGIRLLFSASVILWCMVPGVASAIGFGKPIVDSAIGDPLRVVVPLVSIQQGELEDLDVGIADASWYQISGLDYSDLAQQLNVNLEIAEANSSIVVSTAQGVNQVAVPLVLELTWPQRVMRKQFTVLLNPAGYQSGVLVQGAILGAEQTEQSAIPEQQSVIDTAQSYGITEQSSDQLEATNTSSNASVRPSTILVNNGDSLSTIVDNFLPPGANRFQGRMAFYSDNPAAFQNGDIHLLTRGVTLSVPTEQAILAIPSAQARQDYQQLAKINTQQIVEAETEVNVQSGSGQGEFSLSLLEVSDNNTTTSSSEVGATNSSELNQQSDSSSGSSTTASTVPQALADNSNAAPSAAGPQFAMQGFTMKLTVLNAYIVELQDENRQLKDRVAALEQKMEALIRRGSTFQGDPLALDTDGIEQSIEADQKDDSAESLLAPLDITNQSFTEGGDETAAVDEVYSDQDDGSGNLSGVDQQSAGGSDVSESASDLTSDDSVAELTAEQVQLQADALTESELLAASQGSTGLSAVNNAEVNGAEEAAVPPRIVYRRNLFEQASNFINQFNTPVIQLLLGVLLGGLLLLAWLLRRANSRNDDQFLEDQAAEQFDGGDDIQIAYSTDNNMTMLDLDEEESWVAQPEISEENLNSLQESDVDLITQSEVYLTYNRPMQAIQALLEEYAKPDSDKFVVASRLIKIYEQTGENDDRNSSLRTFIVTLNNDIELYSSAEWDNLRFDLDALRRTEQQIAVEKSHEEDAPTMSTKQQELSVDDIDVELTAEDVNDLGDGVVELDFHPTDKANSN